MHDGFACPSSHHAEEFLLKRLQWWLLEAGRAGALARKAPRLALASSTPMQSELVWHCNAPHAELADVLPSCFVSRPQC